MRSAPEFYAGDLYGEMYQADTPAPKVALREYFPGLALCTTAALAAAWLAGQYGFPVILLGLLLGLALNFVSQDQRTAPGLDFASRHFLRLGIVALGLQVTLMQVAGLGVATFAALLAVMASAFAAGLLGARLVGQPKEAGILAGGATAICGASAALALYGVIGKDRLDQSRFAITLVGVALASAVAMTAYPLIAELAAMTDRQAGFLIGAAVHDVAQAIGAAYGFSDAAGGDATVVKLARVSLLAPVVAIVAVWLASGSSSDVSKPLWRQLAVPWFIVGFLVLVGVNSVVSIPGQWAEVGLTVSKALLLLAVVSTAMRTRMDLMLEAGWRPLVPVMAATLTSFIAALGLAMMLPG